MKKRVLSFLLCLVMVLGTLVYIAPDTSANAAVTKAASTVKLNSKKKTLFVSDTFTLALKNASGKVKFSSSNKKVVTVSSKGVVTAMGKGKATVTAKNDGKTYKCKFTVKEDNRYIIDRIFDEKNPLSPGCGNYEIKLSGNKDDHVITDRLCYLKGDKFILFLDKDVDLPGDFADKVALVMDTLEEKTGLKFSESNYISTFGNMPPWENVDNGKRIPIYVNTDRVDGTYISNASGVDCTIVMYELISQEVWDSVPSYKENGWRRGDHISYDTIAHELAHVLTLRYANLSDIMTEGSAEYYSDITIKALADKDEEFAKCYEYIKEVRSFIVGVETKITKKNMESIFIDDYRELSEVDRTDKYTLGRIICEYLSQNYGENFMKDYLDILAKNHYNSEEAFGDLVPEDIEVQAKLFKKLFGKKVFEKIADYYNKNYSK